MTPVYKQEFALLSDKEIRKHKFKVIKGSGKKAYVRLITTAGNLNFMIHCDLVPMTAHNFLELCHKKYYDKTIFHRLIVSFMIQGGDPEGTGYGGKGAWADTFKDEIHKLLKHDKRGILSMANSGEDTNGSQFFISFGECSHLDEKHSVFGELVGGMDVLNKIERFDVDDRKRPLEPITILGTVVYDDPFKNVKTLDEME